MIRLVIVNPMAGTGRGEKYLKSIDKIFSNVKKEGKIKDDKIFLELTKAIGDATLIVKDYLSKYNEEFVIYVVGGDGTISEVAYAIKHTPNASMVVIPKGTGNDFAKVTNSYKSMRKIIRESLNKNSEVVDSIKLKDRLSMNVVNLGFDAAIANNMEKFRHFPFISGSMKYRLSIFYTLFSAKKYRLKVRVDDKIFKGSYTLVAIGNNKYYGGGVKILPDAIMTDGVLDICLVDSTTLMQKLRYLPKLTKGKHTNLKIVKMLKGENISVVSNKKFPVSIDGEIIETNRLHIKVDKNSIRIIKTLDN